MRLSEELARIIPGRRRRRPADQAPREIVPRERAEGDDVPAAIDAARERLRAEIPAPPDDDER